MLKTKMDMYSFLCIIIVIFCMSAIEELKADPHYPCPASLPCTCDGNKIDCSNRTINNIPYIRHVNHTWTYGWSVDLSYNKIKTIPAGAFKNIKINSLEISHNEIEEIHDDAFQGSENNIDSVFIQFNKMQQFPEAFGTLQKMTMFSIHDNPIQRFPAEQLAKLTTVQFLDIGSSEMTDWPKGICSMTALYSLDIYGLNIPIPNDGFQGCEEKPLILWIESGNFKEFPSALRSLRNMTDIMINNNPYLSSESFAKDSFKGMDSLRSLYMENTSLTRVPDLTELPSLTDLSITDSPITTWDMSTVHFPSKITRVTLDKTDIVEVPQIISKLKSLMSLSVFQTKISRLDSSDVSHLRNLSFVTLENCPLNYVANNAFLGIKNLTAVSLGNTLLTSVPKAFLHVTTLKMIEMYEDNIECSCENLGWLKNWKALNTTFVDGKCSNFNDVYLGDFIRKNVTQC